MFHIFVELPCKTQPPDAPSGGFKQFGMEETIYQCQVGYGFSTGNYYETSECTPAKTWEPSVLPVCESKFRKKYKIIIAFPTTRYSTL